jgi:hypothetical protein
MSDPLLLRGAYFASALISAALGGWAAVRAIAAGPGGGDDCDNMAGECLHMRQSAAILAIRTACVLAAAIPAFAALHVRQGARPSRALVGLVFSCAAVAVLVIAVDPIQHLSNRWSGWLGGNP